MNGLIGKEEFSSFHVHKMNSSLLINAQYNNDSLIFVWNDDGWSKETTESFCSNSHLVDFLHFYMHIIQSTIHSPKPIQ